MRAKPIVILGVCAAAVAWLGGQSYFAAPRNTDLLRLMEHETIERVAAIREANERRRDAAKAAPQTEHQKALLRIVLLTALAGNKASP